MMASKGVKFTRDAAERISRVVRRVERTRVDLTSPKTKHKSPRHIHFWAELQSHDGSAYYTFNQVRRNDTDTGWSTVTDGYNDTDYGTALEVNGVEILCDDGATPIVRMHGHRDEGDELRMEFEGGIGSGNWTYSDPIGPPAGGSGFVRDGISIAGGFWALLDSNSSPFQWTEAQWDGSKFARLADGRDDTNRETAKHHQSYATLPINTLVIMRPIMDTSGNVEYVFWLPHDGEYDQLNGGAVTRNTTLGAPSGDTTAVTPAVVWEIDNQSANSGVRLPWIYDWGVDEGNRRFRFKYGWLHFDVGGRLLRAEEVGEVDYTGDACP